MRFTERSRANLFRHEMNGTHGSIKVLPGIAKRKIRKRKDNAEALNMETAVPGFIPKEGQHRQHIYHP